MRAARKAIRRGDCTIWAGFLCLYVLSALATSAIADEPSSPDTDVLENAVAYLKSHANGESVASIQLNAWSSDTSNLPIGVFDSGIGGLTVLEAILQLDAYNNSTLAPGSDGRPDFEHERFIYLGDQANMPYGNYGTAGKENFLRELILRDATFLLGRNHWPSPDSRQPVFGKPPVKAIVIACNTATAYGLQDIRDLSERLRIPVVVVGVVEAGARGVLEELPKSPDTTTVAVLATTGTCNIGAYPRAIGSTMGLAGRRNPLVIQQGSVGLAGAIEGDPAFISPHHHQQQPSRAAAYQGPSAGHPTASLEPSMMNVYQFEPAGLLGSLDQPDSLQLNSPLNYIRYDITTLVEAHRKSGNTTPITAVVLGCTHFPLVDDEFLAEFKRLRNLEIDGRLPYQHLIAEELRLINPAELTAKELFRKLAGERRLAQPKATEIAGLVIDSRCQLFVSLPNRHVVSSESLTASGAFTTDYKYGRMHGTFGRDDVLIVPMTASTIPEAGRQLIRNRLPAVSAFLPEQ